MPAVSILIVTYRNPELTRRCLRAVQREVTTLDAEVLVLDNASPDGTAEMIREEFDWIDFEASPDNLGFARGNNVLASRAIGNHLLLLNPDAILHPGAIHALLAAAERDPQAGMYGGRTVRPSGELDPASCWGFMTLWSLVCFATGLSTLFKKSRLFNPELLGDWRRDTEREVDMITGCLLLVDRSHWQRLDGFDESFWMYGEDQDLAIRARSMGLRPIITPDAIATHVLGASSSSGNKNVMVLGSRVHLMRKHWSSARRRLGILLLVCGCGLRALGADSDIGWRDGWRRRGEWARPGLSGSSTGLNRGR